MLSGGEEPRPNARVAWRLLYEPSADLKSLLTDLRNQQCKHQEKSSEIQCLALELSLGRPGEERNTTRPRMTADFKDPGAPSLTRPDSHDHHTRLFSYASLRRMNAWL